MAPKEGEKKDKGMGLMQSFIDFQEEKVFQINIQENYLTREHFISEVLMNIK